MRVILDTNVLVSALLRRDGPPGLILEAWFEDRFVLLSHVLQLEELRAVTRRHHLRPLLRAAEAGRIVNQIKAHAVLVDRLPYVRRSADPSDDFLLALAETGQANYLVTGDKAGLLGLKRHQGTTILAASDFCVVLGL